MDPLVAGLALLQSVGVAAVTGPILRRLPAPVDEPETDPYRPLATPRFALVAAALSLVAALLTGLLLAPGLLPAWLALNTLGVLLGCIDARTTFLPAVLTWAAGLLAALGVGISAWWLQNPWLLAQAALGALFGWGLFWLFWRFGRGFGFGDVRLAAVIGATAGVVSPTFPLLALLAGAIAGGVWGVVALIGGRRGYPYGPSLVMGPYLAMLALSWSGG